MKKRTTKFYFDRFGIRIVLFKPEYRKSVRVTQDQIDRAREMMIETKK